MRVPREARLERGLTRERRAIEVLVALDVVEDDPDEDEVRLQHRRQRAHRVVVGIEPALLDARVDDFVARAGRRARVEPILHNLQVRVLQAHAVPERDRVPDTEDPHGARRLGHGQLAVAQPKPVHRDGHSDVGGGVAARDQLIAKTGPCRSALDRRPVEEARILRQRDPHGQLENQQRPQHGPHGQRERGE